MTYNWQRRIDRPNEPAVPLRLKRMRRTFWCRPRYEHVVRYIATHPSFTQREIAEACGVTLAFVQRALGHLREWGALVLRTTRGRLGRTHAELQSDVRLANVSPTGERIFLRPTLRISSGRSVGDTFGLGAAYSLRDVLAEAWGIAS